MPSEEPDEKRDDHRKRENPNGKGQEGRGPKRGQPDDEGRGEGYKATDQVERGARPVDAPS